MRRCSWVCLLHGEPGGGALPSSPAWCSGRRLPIVTIVLGLSFVALRVHYLSDVLAGLALGAIAFTICEALVEPTFLR
jgi:hypothetical protein